MCARSRTYGFLVATAALLATTTATAQYDDDPYYDEQPAGRWEIWLALTTWPALQDLQPAVGGSFDSTGYGIGAAMHWPFRQTSRSELLLGFDVILSSTNSSIPTVYDDQLARHVYLGGSLKCLFGKSRNVSIDAGLGYHLVDITEVTSDYPAIYEFENWTNDAAGAYIGASWDVGAGRPERSGGLTLAVRAHFVDLGTVRDQSSPLYASVLGYNAGSLDGPMYFLQAGYWSR